MDTKHESKCRKWKSTIFLLCGVLWVLNSEIAFSSPYVSRSLCDAFGYEVVLMNVALVLNAIAFWSCLFVMLCVWLCSARVSRIVLFVWWAVVLPAQWGWVYLTLR